MRLCQKLSVSTQPKPAPKTVATAIPPATPSQVLFGEVSLKACLPQNLPTKNAPLSHATTVKISHAK